MKKPNHTIDAVMIFAYEEIQVVIKKRYPGHEFHGQSKRAVVNEHVDSNFNHSL